MDMTLPIALAKGKIIDTVRAYDTTIITAETSAGKTTQVPQYLLESFDYVIVTQPRRMIARAVATRVAEEMGVELGGLVGYQTALDRKVGPDTRLAYVTDGLELMYEFFGSKPKPNSVLVIDEVHEWNLNVEALVALARSDMQNGRGFEKLVIMSATLETEMLVAFFENAEVIPVKGRRYPITELTGKRRVYETTAQLLQQRHNVLVFMPGKAEINGCIRWLKENDVEAEIFPLHAEMTRKDQDMCFKLYDKPKCIVATNVAQTSVTIPGITAVVDSGLERTPHMVDGVEGLYLRPISLTDREQRKGRAGREKPGMYADCCPVETKQRPMFSQPAVVTSELDTMVLRMLMAGVNPEEAGFVHKPTQEQFDAAYDVLITLGCLNEEHQLTDAGVHIARLPVDARMGRMLDYAFKNQASPGRAITLAAVLVNGGITNQKGRGWEQFAPEMPTCASDALTEVAAFEAASGLPERDLERFGIDRMSFLYADETRKRLEELFAERVKAPILASQPWKVLADAFCAGYADRLYKKSLVGAEYKDSKGRVRELPQHSKAKGMPWVIGKPWNIQARSDHGPRTRRLITLATPTTPEELVKICPHLQGQIKKLIAKGFKA